MNNILNAPFIYLLIYLNIYLFIYLFTYSFIYLFCVNGIVNIGSIKLLLYTWRTSIRLLPDFTVYSACWRGKCLQLFYTVSAKFNTQLNCSTNLKGLVCEQSARKLEHRNMLLVHISDSKLIFQICIEWQKSESGLIAEGSWTLFLFWFSVWWRFWMIVVEPERLYDMNGQCWCEYKWEFEILIDCVLYTRNNLKQVCDACYVQSLDLPV